MSELRDQLIDSGKLVTVEQKQIAERLAPQLYEVAKRVEDGQDSVPYDNVPWKSAPRDVRAVFLAIARYVAGTYAENDRLRAKVARLDQEVRDVYDRLQAAHTKLARLEPRDNYP